MPLPPDLSKPIFTLMPHLADRIIDNRCAVCCSPISPDEFKNDLSKKEYSISGMCQKCQDAIFGVEEEEEEGIGM